MADMVTQKDIGSLVTARVASAFAASTAGGAGNAAAVTGPTLQRSLIGMPRSAALVLAFTATLAAGKTLSLGAVSIQDSADGVSFAPYQLFVDPGIVATGPANGGTMAAEVTLKAALSGARDYVRVVFTPTLSATATDTATVLALLLFAGFSLLPSPQ